jgi:hypothetical protein
MTEDVGRAKVSAEIDGHFQVATIFPFAGHQVLPRHARPEASVRHTDAARLRSMWPTRFYAAMGSHRRSLFPVQGEYWSILRTQPAHRQQGWPEE